MSVWVCAWVWVWVCEACTALHSLRAEQGKKTSKPPAKAQTKSSCDARDDAAAREQISEHVPKHVRFFRMPPMPKRAVEEFVASRRLLGQNTTKNGATGQDDANGALTAFRALETPLGDFFREADATLADIGDEGNAFIRLNNGKVRRLPSDRHGSTGLAHSRAHSRSARAPMWGACRTPAARAGTPTSRWIGRRRTRAP